MRWTRHALLVTLALAAACSPGSRDNGGDGADDDGADVPDAGGFVDAQDVDPNPTPTGQCTKVDFLFVIDNSASMDDVQTRLIQAFPQFIQVIDQYSTDQGSMLDYRIAVTTTGRDVMYNFDVPIVGKVPMNEMGDDGELRKVPGQAQRRWIERADGNVSQTFGQVAKVGTGGPSLEMQFLSLEWALDKQAQPGLPNAGFLRDDALLAVVLVSDEDDCSRPDDGFSIADDRCDPVTPEMLTPESVKAFLDGQKGEGRWATAVIAIPPGSGGCPSSGQDSNYQAEGERLKAFADLAGTNGVFADLCAASYSQALEQALETFTGACENFPPVD